MRSEGKRKQGRKGTKTNCRWHGRRPGGGRGVWEWNCDIGKGREITRSWYKGRKQLTSTVLFLLFPPSLLACLSRGDHDSKDRIKLTVWCMEAYRTECSVKKEKNGAPVPLPWIPPQSERGTP